MQTYSMTKEEQETTINWDASGNKATVFTATPTVIRKLEKLSAEFPDTYKKLRIDRWGGYWYEVPVKYIKFGKPPSEARIAAGKKLYAHLQKFG